MSEIPTFDQSIYTPDPGEKLTREQAIALLAHVRERAERLALRVVAELEARHRLVPQRDAPYRPTSVDDLVRIGDRGRAIRPDEVCVGVVRWVHPMSGPPLAVALVWEWITDRLHVGWGLVEPVPDWSSEDDASTT